MQGNRIEDGMPTFQLIDGKKVVDPDVLAWRDTGQCRQCGMLAQAITYISRQALGVAVAPEEMIAGERQKVQDEIAVTTILGCPDCQAKRGKS